jgi:PAS domain S-box-containing protein
MKFPTIQRGLGQKSYKWLRGHNLFQKPLDRKLHFEDLRKSEALLAEAERVGQIGSWEHDLVRGQDVWSANLCRMLGVDPTKTKLSEELFWELLHPDDREGVRTVIEGGMKFAHDYEYQSRFILPGGRQRTFYTWGKPILGPDNQVIKRMGVTQDISVRVEAERSLMESEERYRDLVESSHDLICTHDLTGRVLSMNELPARLLGYCPKELIGRCIPDHLPGGGARIQFEEYIERIKRDGFANGLMALMTRSGERRIWEYQNTLRTEGVSAPLVRGMAHDVTEKIKAQTELRESTARLQALVNSIDQIAFEFDADGTFLDIWTTDESLLFRPREKLLGRRVSEVLRYDTASVYEDIFKRVLESGKGEDLEYSLHVLGGKRWFLGRVTPIVAPDGTYKSICMLARDITDRKQAEDVLHQKDATIRSLFHIAQTLTKTLELDAILEHLNYESMMLIGAEGSSAGILSAKEFTCDSFFDRSGPKKKGITWPPDAGLLGWVLTNKRTYLTNDAPHDPLIPPEIHNPLGLRSVLCVPVLGNQEEVIAFFALHNKRGGDFRPSDVETVEGISKVASIAIQNALTYQRTCRAEEDLRVLSAQLINMQDEERRRIALELHEGLAQDLAALRLSLGHLKRKTAKDENGVASIINESLKLNDNLIQHVRAMSYTLHPPHLQEVGLPLAITSYAHEFSERSGIEVLVRADLPKDISHFPRGCEITIFRIIQECLSNVYRHAHSHIATVSVLFQNEHLILEVADRGWGMGAASKTETESHHPLGIGIASMRERVKQMHGTFLIESVVGQGVTVRVVLPVAIPVSKEARN